jgi:hypothetical protein
MALECESGTGVGGRTSENNKAGEVVFSTKAKEAIKIGLAFVLVYAIAIKTAWMNPYWAAFAVVFIALSTTGQSIHKGVNRMAGTIGGGIGTSTNNNGGKSIIDMFNADSLSLGLIGSFSWNIFNYGRIESNVRLQDAVFQEQLVDYRNLVLQVQGEVENAIVAYLKSHEQAESYGLSADFAQRAYLFMMYIVISNPYRISVYAGFVHCMFLTPLTNSNLTQI